MYSQREDHIKKIEDTNSKTNEFYAALSIAQKSSEASQVVFKKFKTKQFENLFANLDTDNDGYISYNSIEKEKLDKNLKESLSGFFTTLEQYKEKINLHKFSEMLENCTKHMTVEQRAYVLKRDLKKSNENCEKAISSHRSNRSSDLYERLIGASKNRQEKINRLKEDKIKDELKHCTFKPKFNKFS